MPSQTWISLFASGAGLALFMTLFALVLVYALKPSNRQRFDRAAETPLRED